MNNKIRNLLTARDLTQTELGHRCRLDPSYLSKIILGRITPTVPTARKIADELGVGIDDIFPASNDKNPERSSNTSLPIRKKEAA